MSLRPLRGPGGGHRGHGGQLARCSLFEERGTYYSICWWNNSELASRTNRILSDCVSFADSLKLALAESDRRRRGQWQQLLRPGDHFPEEGPQARQLRIIYKASLRSQRVCGWDIMWPRMETLALMRKRREGFMESCCRRSPTVGDSGISRGGDSNFVNCYR